MKQELTVRVCDAKTANQGVELFVEYMDIELGDLPIL